MPKPPSTRDRLLDAALRAFATNGVDGTPIIELEEAAGLAPGSGGFYRYFRTKDQALEAAVRREIDKVVEQRAPVSGEQGDDRRAWLTDEFDRALDMLSTIGPLIAILARERSRIPELAREIAEQLVTGGARHASDDVAVGAIIVSAIVGYHLATDYFGSPPAGVDRQHFVQALVDLLIGSL